MTNHSYFPYTIEHLQLHASQYKQKTHPSHPLQLHRHTTYLNTPSLKNTIFNNGRYTTIIPIDHHTTDIKTNMRHIYTSIVSRHLATKGNNKILRTPPPHIISSEKIPPASLVALLPNSEQINHPSSKHTCTKSTPNHIHHHYAPSVTLTHTHDTPHLFNCTHIVTPGFVDIPAGVTALLARWTEKLAGGSDSHH